MPDPTSDAAALVGSYLLIFLGLFLLTALVFGYPGVILFVVASTAIMLTGIVIVTSTGLGRPN